MIITKKLQSLKVKFPLYITILCILISGILVFIFTSKGLAQLKSEYEKRAQSISLNISNEVIYGLLTEDSQVISQVVSPQLKQPDILYIKIVAENEKNFLLNKKKLLSKVLMKN